MTSGKPPSEQSVLAVRGPGIDGHKRLDYHGPWRVLTLVHCWYCRPSPPFGEIAVKIVVLNGSPKGMTSVTMQYVLFLRKKLPQHEFTILNVCQDVRKLESDEQVFLETIKSVAESDGVLWAFPLYYLLVHGGYKRFIELVFARGAGTAFEGKYAAVLTTSIHFFDHTAHEYLNGICDDLGMKYVGSYSAEMQDLLREQERDRLLLFADDFLHAIEERRSTPQTISACRARRLQLRARQVNQEGRHAGEEHHHRYRCRRDGRQSCQDDGPLAELLGRRGIRNQLAADRDPQSDARGAASADSTTCASTRTLTTCTRCTAS